MSKSLKRVRAALEAAGLDVEIREMAEGTRTAEAAASAVGCAVDQIAKSIIFRDSAADGIVLFITAGGNQIDPSRAAEVAGTPLERADAGHVRKVTGFAIGGVAPIGHLNPPVAYFDPRLLEFDTVWAAAGTPNHVFACEPGKLCEISNAQQSEFTTLSGEM